jgi:hypothetical protein
MNRARPGIGAIVAALVVGNSAAATDEGVLGKYVCAVAHMAGIERRDGTVASGNFRPADSQFIIDIHAAIHPSDVCATHSGTQNDWFVCHATFELQIDDKWRLRGDNPISFSGPLLAETEVFLLYEDNHSFTRFQTQLSSGGYFVSDGKCSKIRQ